MFNDDLKGSQVKMQQVMTPSVPTSLEEIQIKAARLLKGNQLYRVMPQSQPNEQGYGRLKPTSPPDSINQSQYDSPFKSNRVSLPSMAIKSQISNLHNRTLELQQMSTESIPSQAPLKTQRLPKKHQHYVGITGYNIQIGKKKVKKKLEPIILPNGRIGVSGGEEDIIKVTGRFEELDDNGDTDEILMSIGNPKKKKNLHQKSTRSYLKELSTQNRKSNNRFSITQQQRSEISPKVKLGLPPFQSLQRTFMSPKLNN